MSYDANSQRISQQGALGRVTTCGYDAAGNQQTLKIDPHGVAISYVYDLLDRSVVRLYPDGSCVTFGYDPVGRQTLMQNAATGATVFRYDLARRLYAYMLGLSLILLSYTWDVAGRRLRTAESAFERTATFFYGFDSQQNARVLTDGDGNVTYIYTAFGVEME